MPYFQATLPGGATTYNAAALPQAHRPPCSRTGEAPRGTPALKHTHLLTTGWKGAHAPERSPHQPHRVPTSEESCDSCPHVLSFLASDKASIPKGGPSLSASPPQPGFLSGVRTQVTLLSLLLTLPTTRAQLCGRQSAWHTPKAHSAAIKTPLFSSEKEGNWNACPPDTCMATFLPSSNVTTLTLS